MPATTTATALSVGLETLRANPLRTVLSTLGVVVGVASLVAVLAVGDGMEQYGLESIEKEGMQTVVAQPNEGEQVDGVFVPRAVGIRLTSADADDLARALPAGSEVTMRGMGAGLVTASGGGRARGAMLIGSLPGSKGIGFTVAHGRPFTASEARTGARLVVISPELADSLAAPAAGATMVGRPVSFASGAPLTVVGIGAPSEFAPRRNLAVVPADLLGEVTVQSVRGRPVGMEVRAPSVGDVPAVQKAMEAWAKARYGARAGELKVSALTSAERIEQMRRGVLAFKLFMGAIVGISLLVGGIGIMNVLLASVTERTREIGIRRTTGARRRDILEQFLAESVVITSAGAAVGVVIGLTGAFGITAGIRALAKVPIHAAFSGWTLLIAMGVSVAVGLVFGTYPARRAARLSPIDAIRHE